MPHLPSPRQAFCLTSLALTTLVGSRPGSSPRESTEVVRAQLELSVCDVRSAGTDDAVSATLGDGVTTWLDRPGPDFARGGRYTYDLLLDNVHTLADIARLEVNKSGTDDLCLRELRLIVNGRTIFLRNYANGTWLDATPRHTLENSGAELRANASWQSYAWSMPEWIAATGAAMSRQELTERLMSCVASAIHDAGLAWNDGAEHPIEVRRKNDSTISVGVSLVRRVPYWVNSQFRLDFDISLCGAEQAEPTVVNVRVQSEQHWYNVSTDDQQLLMTLRGRLVRSRPLVVVGGVCPHVDRNVNLLY